jgi:hypothetical protein
LVFLADGLSFAAWFASFFARRVYWRNRSLRIGRDGRIVNESGIRADAKRHSEPQA